MRLVFISDTHNCHNEIEIPGGDVLIHCGDALIGGSKSEREDFVQWWNKQPHKHKLFTAGNHDICWQTQAYWANQDLQNLHEHYFTIDGIKFYCASWSVQYGDWAYMLPERLLKHEWPKIPSDTDVLITHGPPYRILDFNYAGNPCGSESLREEVLNRIKPKIHAFGHVHESYGALEKNGIAFINAAICDRSYSPDNNPIVIEI